MKCSDFVDSGCSVSHWTTRLTGWGIATLTSRLDTFSLNILSKWSRITICYHSAADKMCEMLSEQVMCCMYPNSFLFVVAYLVLCVVCLSASLFFFLILTAVTCSASPVVSHLSPPKIKTVLSLHLSACVCRIMRHSDCGFLLLFLALLLSWLCISSSRFLGCCVLVQFSNADNPI